MNIYAYETQLFHSPNWSPARKLTNAFGRCSSITKTFGPVSRLRLYPRTKESHAVTTYCYSILAPRCSPLNRHVCSIGGLTPHHHRITEKNRKTLKKTVSIRKNRNTLTTCSEQIRKVVHRGIKTKEKKRQKELKEKARRHFRPTCPPFHKHRWPSCS